MANNNHFSENNQGLQVGTNEGSITFNQSQTEHEIDRLCLRQLRCPDSRLMKNILKESKDKLRRESFEWILQDPKYQSWRDGDEVCLLWIKGGAGKGKTMISIGLIEELLQFCKENSSAVTYFFCQNANAELNTLPGMMKGLILQLINQRPALKECLRSRWNTAQASFDQDLTSWRSLWHLLLEMIDQCDCSKTYLVVDALDECEDGEVGEFLKALVMNGLHSPDRRGVKWLLTSRPLDSAERTLLAGYDQVQLSLELESDHLSKAVKSYITQKVNELSHKKEYGRHLKEQVESQLLQKSEETFLWVSLVCKRLEDVFPDDVLGAIQNIPDGLRPLYGQVIKQLSCGQTKKIQMCMRLLKVMMLAYRPLKIGEVASIAGFEDGEDVSLMPLIAHCASFLRIREQSIEFVHQSARDYLAEKGQQLILDSHGVFGHWDIAMNCLSYLSRSLKVNLLNLPPDTDLKTIEAMRAEKKSFLLENVEYVAIFWGQHVQDAGSIHCRHHVIGKEAIIAFLYTKLLEWFECLSLLGMLAVAMETLQYLEKLFKDEPLSLSFVGDSTRFLSRHLDTVEEFPLQVYIYAVIWSPESSSVRARNLDRVPWLRSYAPFESTWGLRKLRFLKKIDNQVESKVSSDGKLMATVCERVGSESESVIYIWDIATGSMQWELSSEFTQGIREMGFSQDSKKIIWISKTDDVHSWEMSGGDVHGIRVEHPGFGAIVALSSASTQVASVVYSHGIFIWDTSTGKVRVNVLLDFPGCDQQLFFSLGDTQIMCEVSHQEICIWDATTGGLKKKLAKPPRFLRCLAHSADGNLIVYRSSDDELFSWDIISSCGEWLVPFSYNKEKLVISPDVRTLAKTDRLLIDVWNVRTGNLQALFFHDDNIIKMAFSPNGKSLVYLTYHGEICVKDVPVEAALESPRQESHDPFYGDLPLHVAFSHDGKRVVCCERYGDNLTIVDVRTGSTQKTIPVPVDEKRRIITARFSTCDQKIVVGMEGHVMIWDAATDDFQSIGDGTVSTIVSSPDGKYLAGIVHENTIRIWNIHAKTLVLTIEAHEMELQCLTFSPDGKRIASYAMACQSSTHLSLILDFLSICIWDISQSLKTGKLFGNALNSQIRKRPKRIEIPAPLSMPNVLKFSADGQYLFSNNHSVVVGDIGSQDEVVISSPPSLYVDYKSPFGSAWIYCGGQPFIKLPSSIPIHWYSLDVQDEKMVIGYSRRAFLILDIDTKVLSETFNLDLARTSVYGRT